MKMRVSVIMAVHNNAQHLAAAIESILAQTYADWEFIIVDDASTDGSTAILEAFNDPRIKRLSNPENVGLTISLNRGIRAAHGEYIARMDADDLSLPARFEKQVAFLDDHPNFGILGTSYQRIDRNGDPVGIYNSKERSSHFVRWSLHFRNVICHSSVMMRRSVLDAVGLYDETCRYSQDYELWLRASQATEIKNLAECLHIWREGEGQVSQTKGAEQMAVFYKAQGAAVDRLLGGGVDCRDILRKVETGVPFESPREMRQAACLINRMRAAFLAGAELDSDDRRLISADAAEKLRGIAAANLHVARISALWLYAQSTALVLMQDWLLRTQREPNDPGPG